MSQKDINYHYLNNFKISFSNIPTVGDFRDLTSLYDNFVQSLSIPEYNLEVNTDYFMDRRILHPISKQNDQLDSLRIEFIADEHLYNYINLQKYMQELRFGNIDPESFARNHTIKEINLFVLDNEKRTKSIFRYSDCFLVSVSSLELQMGTAELTKFSCVFEYTDFGIFDPQ